MEENNEIIVFQLWDLNGKIIAQHGEIEKLPTIFSKKINENFHSNGLRNVYRKNEVGSVRLIVGDDNQSFQGTRGVTRGCAIFLNLIPYFKQNEKSHRQHFDSIIRRFAHNLIKFQTRFKGNFDRLISDNARSRPFAELKKEVKRRIESNTDIAAEDVCQISHRAVDLDAQIETLRIISGYADTPLDSTVKVDLQKTIFRLANPFFDEFKKRNIEININIPPVKSGTDKVLIDPGLFNAAVWQLLDNASKYALDGEKIEITSKLNENPKKLEFSMTSVCINDDEKDLIFLEGYKGRNAGKKAEHGIGLFIVKKALNLMASKIHVDNGCFVSNSDNFKYCRNKFIIEFPLSH